MSRKKAILAIPAILLTIVLSGLVYGYCIYHGYLQLNNPSKVQYPVRGVDVSRYQGEIDWNLLAQQDVQFAYMKASEGSSHVDEKFAYNWNHADETELKTGAYHFFSFDSPGETQAENFINVVGIREGMLPPVIDVEYYADKKVNSPQPDDLREQLQVILDKVQEYYQTVPVIYSTEEMWEGYLKGYFDGYPLWIRNVFTKPDSEADWTFWQYSNRGRLKGYSGEEEFIDLNVFCGGEEEWNQWFSGNAVTVPAKEESLFVQMAGTWHLDGEMTNRLLEKNGNSYHSLQEMFGTGLSGGNELTIGEDGTIEYHIGIGNGGTGQGVIDGDEVSAVITPYEDHSSEEEILTLCLEQGESRIYLVMDYWGEKLYWVWQ